MNIAIEWLKELDSEIRKFIPHRTGDKVGSNHPNRNLTNKEWEKIKKIVDKYDLPCTLRSNCYGFSLTIYENKDVTIFSKTRPKRLMEIQDLQFPFPSAKRGFDGQEETLRQLAPLTHGDKNKLLLESSGFEPLNPPECYAY